MTQNIGIRVSTLAARGLTNLLKAQTVAVLACIVFGQTPGLAGDFSVNPISLDLGAAAKSGVFIVKNDGTERLSFQLNSVEWTQDAEGKEQYADSWDLIFFPKIMTVEPGKEGVIRVGIKTPVVATEKTYRLFIEELPGVISKEAESGTAKINVLIRFGAPIFVSPVKPQDSLDIENFSLAKGNVTLSAKNTGNRHQVVQGIELRGTDTGGSEVYALTLADRYLLTGTAKSYTTSIPAEQCTKITQLALEFKTDKLNVARKLDVTRAMCP